MKIRLYQVNLARDYANVAFENYDELPGDENKIVDKMIYDAVFDGDVEARTLEDVHVILNCTPPKEYRGRSFAISDVLEIIDSDEIEKGTYYCDFEGFKKIEFNA